MGEAVIYFEKLCYFIDGSSVSKMIPDRIQFVYPIGFSD